MIQLSTSKLTNGRGAVLLLMAGLVVMLFGLMALVIDAGIGLTTKHQLTRTAESAALAAMSQYLNQLGDGIPNAAEAARARATQLANINVSLGQPFMQNPSKPGGFNSIGQTQTDKAGTIHFGIWHFDGNMCACPDGHAGCEDSQRICTCGEPPCFEEFSAAENTRRKANAIKVGIRTPDNNLLKSIFAGAMGSTPKIISAEGFASMVPYNFIVLVDLSRSAYRSNYYWAWNPSCIGSPNSFISCPEVSGEPPNCNNCQPGNWANCSICDGSSTCNDLSCPGTCTSDHLCPEMRFGPGAEFAFELTDSAGLAEGATPDGSSLQAADFMPFGRRSGDYRTWSGMIDVTIPANQPGIFPVSQSGFDNIDWHYRDQYRYHQMQLTPMTDDWDAGAPAIHHMLIDYAAPPASSSFSAEPQPLTDIISAIHYTIEQLSLRAVPDDRLAIYGFDEDLHLERSIHPLQSVEMTEGSPLKDFFSATAAPPNIANWLDKGLIPIVANSDVKRALDRALDTIVQSNTQAVARNVVLLITDGQGNCSSRMSNGFYCRNDPVHMQDFLDDISQPEFTEGFVSARTSVSVALVGNSVGPHRLLVRSLDGRRCFDELDAQDYPGTNFVDSASGGASFPGTDSMPFRLSNELYAKLVAPTRGLWIPVMPQYCSADGNSHPGFSDSLSEICANATNVAGGAPIPLACLPNENGGCSNIDITDAAGRLKCDPYAGTVADQMRRAIDKLIQSPYMVVQPKK